MKKNKCIYTLTVKNIIIVTLLILAFLLLISECDNLKIFIITKSLSLLYIANFFHDNKELLQYTA